MQQALIKHIKKYDLVAKSLEIEPVECRPGYGKTRMPVTPKQCNSVGIAHGGAIFSLADMALALASNAHGKMALTLNMFITYVNPGKDGPLVAEAYEVGASSKVANYEIKVTDANGVLVAQAQGLAYKKNAPFPPSE